VLFEEAHLFPTGEVSKDSFARREVMGKITPATTVLINVTDSVEDFASGVLGREETKETTDGRKEVLVELPLLIGHIGLVRLANSGFLGHNDLLA
jgi:hypothetical protein